MVRQDKLYYLVHALRGWECFDTFQKGSVLDSVINAILYPLSGGSSKNKNLFSYILSKYGSIDNIRKVNPHALLQLNLPITVPLKKFQTIINFLDWSNENFDRYNLEKMRDWSNDRIASELLSVPGINSKIVGTVLCIFLDRDVFPVDINILRVMKRFGVVGETLSVNQAYRGLSPVVPVGAHARFHLSLKDFAINVCKSSDPVCDSCIVSKHCSYHKPSEELYD